jgi:GxxExxY protein
MDYINQKFYKSEITSKIIKCAYHVHDNLGNGFQEVVYQRALQYELANNNLIFEREKEMDVFYLGNKVGQRRVDFLIDNDIMVELKAVTELDDTHVAQLVNYLEAYRVKVGLLINFGTKNLQIRRFIK